MQVRVKASMVDHMRIFNLGRNLGHRRDTRRSMRCIIGQMWQKCRHPLRPNRRIGPAPYHRGIPHQHIRAFKNTNATTTMNRLDSCDAGR